MPSPNKWIPGRLLKTDGPTFETREAIGSYAPWRSDYKSFPVVNYHAWRKFGRERWFEVQTEATLQNVYWPISISSESQHLLSTTTLLIRRLLCRKSNNCNVEVGSCDSLTRYRLTSPHILASTFRVIVVLIRNSLKWRNDMSYRESIG